MDVLQRYDPKKSAKKAGKALGVLVVSTAVSAAVPAVLAALADPATVSAVIGEGRWLWAVPAVNLVATAALDWWKHRS